MDDMIIKAVLHRPYKHFSVAFEELKGNQCDSQVSFSTWFLDRYFRNAADYGLRNATHLRELLSLARKHVCNVMKKLEFRMLQRTLVVTFT